MEKKILSFFLIFIVILNANSYNVFAQEIDTEINEPIFKVVLPTNLNFVIDPYEIIDKNSMIASPDFNIINKSSVPVKVNLSFKVSNKNGSIIDIKNNRNEISNASYNNEIWIAALFSTKIENVITNNKVLCTQNGDVVYRYPDGFGIEREKKSELPEKNKINPERSRTEGTDKMNELNSNIQHKSNESDVINDRDIVDNTDDIDNTDSADVISDAKPSDMPAQVVSGSAIATQKSSTSLPTSSCRDIYAMNNIHSMNIISDTATEVVSGSAIAEAESSSTITEIVSGSVIEETVSSSVIAEAVSGSTIAQKVCNSTIAESASGSAIIETMSGSAIEKQNSTDINKKEQQKENSDTQTIDKKSELLTEYEEGVPMIYQDTINVTGQYGDLKSINKNSPNVLVINNDCNSYSIILDAAKVYNLSDGSITTGEVAENNQGVVAFRLFGYLNRNAIWKDTGIQVTVIYSIEECQSAEDNEMKNNEMNNKLINNYLNNNLTNSENNNTVPEADSQINTDINNSPVAQESETVIQVESENSKTELNNMDSDDSDKGKENGPVAYSSDQ